MRVHSDAGLVGQAEAQPRPYTYGETQASIVDTVGGPLNEALEGVDPLRIELVAERCAAVAGNYVARGAVDLAVWDLVGQILGCPCHTLLGGFADDVAAAHMVSFGEPAAMADEAIGDQRAARRRHVQGQGRARAGPRRRGGARDPRGAARRRPLRRRQPRLELRRRGAGRRRAHRARRAGDRGADLDRGSRRPAAARRALGGAAGRRRELHQPRARRSRARGGRGPRRERQDGADRASPSRAGSSTSASRATSRSSSAASTRARSAPSATIAFAAAFAATAGQPAEITNFLDLDDDLVVAAPEIRDGRAAVPPAPGLGVEVDEDRLQRYRVDR